MVHDHNSQGETRPDRQQTHLVGGRLLGEIHAPLAQPRPVVPVRPLPQRVPAPVDRAVPVGPADQDVPLRPVVRVLPLRLVLLRHRLGGSRHRSVPVRPEGRAVPVVLVPPVSPVGPAPVVPPDLAPVDPAGRVDLPAAPAAPVAVAQADPVVQEALAAVDLVVREAPVGLAVPAVGSRPASPARTSRPHRRPPRRRPLQPRGDAAAR